MHVEEFPLRVEGRRWRVNAVVRLSLLVAKIFNVGISTPVRMECTPFASSQDKEMFDRSMNELAEKVRNMEAEREAKEREEKK